jgi:hypothetical protein
LRKLNYNHVVLLVGSVVFAGSLAVLGCLSGSGQGTSASQHFAKIGDMQPFVEPYAHAYILTGSPVETEVKAAKSAGQIRFDFLLYGSAIDEEIYSYDDTSFRYVGSRLEEFDPGIPLFKFPFTVGDKWEWSGVYRTGGIERKSTATIATVAERLATVGGEFSTVRVNVELSLESGAQEKAERKLTFWCAPKRGIVRREFQFGTTREPMPPKGTVEGP